MHLVLAKSGTHTGEETYAIVYQLVEQDDLYDTMADGAQYVIRPSSISLVWRRPLGRQTWERDQHNSKILGPRVLKSGEEGDQQSYKIVFSGRYAAGEWTYRISEYAASLPHFATLIGDIEARLPA